MGNIVEELANFTTKAQFSDLPEDVVHETKRVLLDSIGCAIGGLSIGLGRIAVEVARRLAGPPESTIIGTGSKVSCTNAAFANGELINALDYDAGAAGVGHDTSIVIAASLAPAENAHASGKDLLLAIALGHEISTKLQASEQPHLTVTKEGAEKVKVDLRENAGWAITTIAAAASAGKIISLNQEQMANAIGIAGYVCPPNLLTKMEDTAPGRMTKYGLSGWGAQGGIMSALLAERGFTGDTDLFQGAHCFWKFTGQSQWNAAAVLQDLGTKWLHKINYKVYPIGFCIAGAVDNFIRIMEENDLQPEDIQKVTAGVWPLTEHKPIGENKLASDLDFSFSPPYAMACAIYRIHPAHWLDPEIRQDAKIREFMQRVEFEVTCDQREFGLARLKDPMAEPWSAEVVAKGQTFKRTSLYRKGLWRPEEFRVTDEELIEKFRENVRKVLPLDKTDKIVQTMFELEKLKSVAELMEMVAP
jgi:2-methylcitrate dehydratase PrpD